MVLPRDRLLDCVGELEVGPARNHIERAESLAVVGRDRLFRLVVPCRAPGGTYFERPPIYIDRFYTRYSAMPCRLQGDGNSRQQVFASD